MSTNRPTRITAFAPVTPAIEPHPIIAATAQKRTGTCTLPC